MIAGRSSCSQAVFGTATCSGKIREKSHEDQELVGRSLLSRSRALGDVTGGRSCQDGIEDIGSKPVQDIATTTEI